jgi:polyhydroxybutyrate depolymerase
VSGIERSYYIYYPKNNNSQSKLPLLFVNHGGRGNGIRMASLADFRPLAEREGFILVYPNGYKNSWNDGRPTNANKENIDDVNFFSEMIDKFVKNNNADSKRVYVTGISNGGFMSARLGCELSHKITAFASVAATMEQNIFNNCNPKKPVPALFIHGSDDKFVPINGGKMTKGEGGIIVSHKEAIQKWAKINSCDSASLVNLFEDKANDGTLITERIYNANKNTAKVMSYTIQNGGHTWPQGKQYLSERIIGKTSQNMNACNVIWEFFKKHKRE